MIAAIPPFTFIAVSFINFPLALVSFTVSSVVKYPAAPKAAYSPTECPAT